MRALLPLLAPMLSLLAVLAPALAVAVAGAVTVPLVDALKRASLRVDAAPRWAKQALVLVVAPLVVALLDRASAVLGAPVPTRVDAVTPEGVAGVVAALLAFALKHARQVGRAGTTAALADATALDAHRQLRAEVQRLQGDVDAFAPGPDVLRRLVREAALTLVREVAERERKRAATAPASGSGRPAGAPANAPVIAGAPGDPARVLPGEATPYATTNGRVDL